MLLAIYWNYSLKHISKYIKKSKRRKKWIKPLIILKKYSDYI